MSYRIGGFGYTMSQYYSGTFTHVLLKFFETCYYQRFNHPSDHRLFGGNVESNRGDSTYCHALPAERNVRACYCIHNHAESHFYFNAGIEFDLLHDRG